MLKRILLRQLNNERATSKHFDVYLHPYMHLQRQYDLACWHHALSAILGWEIHADIRMTDWLTGLLSSFCVLPTEDCENLGAIDIPSHNTLGEAVIQINNKYKFYAAINQNEQLKDKSALSKAVVKYCNVLKYEASNNINFRNNGMDVVMFYYTFIYRIHLIYLIYLIHLKYLIYLIHLIYITFVDYVS